MMERDDERAQMRYAVALTEWGEAGGYEAEVHWDACSVAAFGIPYEQCRWRDVSTLSGGQQARLQILLLELAGSTLLLLDEPTDNLDLPSAEALQLGLASDQGTVLSVTHDRWFARSFERFLIFTPDGNVREATEPAWD